MRIATLLLSAALLPAQTEPANPFIAFSTVFGGDRDDIATAVATDSAGNTYIAGETLSKNFAAKPVVGPAPESVNNGFVTKLGPDGREALWSVLIGGASATRPNAIALDGEGNLWVTGRTGARNFPLLNPVQDKQTGLNIAFLVKLSPEGKLLYSTYLGGERNDEANAIAIDTENNVYIAGRTNSTTFPAKNALRSYSGGGDAFLAKFTSQGELAWSTPFGGTGADEIFGLAIGPDGGVLAVGETYSIGLATEGAWQDRYLGVSGFAAKFAPSGDQLHWLTYIGARPGYTRALRVTVDRAGNPYVVGHTSARTMPVSENAIQREYSGGMRDAFLLRLTADGSAASYLTYLGGSYSGQSDPDETAVAVALDAHGFVYVAGATSSPDLKRRRAVQDNFGGMQDGWLARIDIENARLISSTFWGGSRRDDVLAIALGPGENVTVVGQSASTDFTLVSPLQERPGGNNDTTVTRVCDPWLGAYPGDVAFVWTIGEQAPDPVEVEVYDGCWIRHEMTVSVPSEAEWLRVSPDRAPVHSKLTIGVMPAGLAPGDHETFVTVTVPEAVNGPLQIPVRVKVVEPPKEEQ